MEISVRLSAALAQLAGAARVQVRVDDDATVADVRAALTATYPALATSLPRAVPIVAGNHAAPGDRVPAGQEVAFLLPVAGGGFRRSDPRLF